MRALLLLLLLAGSALAAPRQPSAVLRPAPDFSFPGAGNQARTLRSLRGQPVILVITRSPRQGDFRAQLKKLRGEYGGFAARGAVFVVAFQEGAQDEPVRSDVPFAISNNGPGVASAYGVQDDFCVVLIGKDGNIDYQTNRVLPAQRIRDVLQNSFAVQQVERK